MTRGKIQIKRIENQTNRQVTYSKRRNGLFKKAHELSILCDARVSVIMFSSSNKLHEYTSPNTSTKEIIDMYQKASGVDIWASHYERMQEIKKQLLETNRNLRKQIKQRLGECLDELEINDLRRLEEEMENTTNLVRTKKFKSLLPLSFFSFFAFSAANLQRECKVCMSIRQTNTVVKGVLVIIKDIFIGNVV
ncbi:PREDICTED: floral homeotic protein APETALA 3-like isoform X2 [Tarenaya hassleriana]|uniref:floral homeotic protein APETALA 3-like isoform X2 n=1 Tax=Tarenaya hassleriana TaxID=28532 RepID=UPI00053C64C6|nr:PREDICTED: floral homeotic protein APETALA 3-like isoform X2 [Tarenaya hassleriana]